MRKTLWIVVGLVAVSSVSMMEPEAQLDLRWADQVDLDGDGDTEDIHLIRLERKHGAFLLTVDGSSVADRLGWQVCGFVVVDIREGDGYKEIAVYTSGPSDDFEYFYFWFNGKSLHRVGKVAGVPHLLGNGIILVDSHMGFWSKRDKYVLTENHVLHLFPQEFYWVGEQATVIRPLSVYGNRDYKSVQTELQVDEKVTIVLYGPGGSPAEGFRGHYLIRSANGQLGWGKSTIENRNRSFKGLTGAG